MFYTFVLHVMNFVSTKKLVTLNLTGRRSDWARDFENMIGLYAIPLYITDGNLISFYGTGGLLLFLLLTA